jgi:hypothetical protein
MLTMVQPAFNTLTTTYMTTNAVTNTGATSLVLTSVVGLKVGMPLYNVGLAANTKITALPATGATGAAATTITIAPATTAAIPANSIILVGLGYYNQVELDFQLQAVEDSTANIIVNFRAGAGKGRFNTGAASILAFAQTFIANFAASSGYATTLLSASQGYAEAYITMQVTGLSDTYATYYYAALPKYSNTPGRTYVS